MKNNKLYFNKENRRINELLLTNKKKSLQPILTDIPLQVSNKIFLHRDFELGMNPKTLSCKKKLSLIPMKNLDIPMNFSKDLKLITKTAKISNNRLYKPKSAVPTRNMMIIKNNGSSIINSNIVLYPQRNLCSFYNEINLFKNNKNFTRNSKNLIIIHLDVLGLIMKRKNSQQSFNFFLDSENFLDYIIKNYIVVIVIQESEISKEIVDTLDRKGGKYHSLYSIKKSKSLIKEGNIILNYSSIFEDLKSQIEEIIILQTLKKSKAENINKNINGNIVFEEFENKIVYFKNFTEEKLKIYYLDEHFHEKNALKSIFQENLLDHASHIDFQELFLFFKRKYLEKHKNFEILQNLKDFKKTIPPNPPKNLEEIYNKSQIEIRKTFFEYLLEMKKHPKTKNLILGPVIDSLLERNSHIFKHIMKIEFEKENCMEKIFDRFSQLSSHKSEISIKNQNEFKDFEKFINLYYQNNLYLI